MIRSYDALEQYMTNQIQPHNTKANNKNFSSEHSLEINTFY